MPIQENPREKFADPRLKVVNTLRLCYGEKVGSLITKRNGWGIRAVRNMHEMYSSQAKTCMREIEALEPDDLSELIGGVFAFASDRQIVNFLQKLHDSIAFPSDGNEVNVTDPRLNDMFDLLSLFPSDLSLSVQSAFEQGRINGWQTSLNLISSEDFPLNLYPSKFKTDLEGRSLRTGGIFLPTALEGIEAEYQYAVNFSSPIVKLNIQEVC